MQNNKYWREWYNINSWSTSFTDVIVEMINDEYEIEENEKVFLYSEPAEGMDKLPYAMTRILETPTTMEMINKPEKTVKFHVL